MKGHPIANIFPMLPEPEIVSLADDIKRHGLREPIWLLDGMILDGRNRHRACELAGVTPTYRSFTGDSPTAFVVSLNLKRRHLTPSQAACAAVEALPWFEREAKKRQGKRNDIGTSVKKLTEVERSTEQAATLFNTNRQYVSDAKAIKENAPEQFEAIKQGYKTITQAKRESREQQRDKRRANNESRVQSVPAITEVIKSAFSTIIIDPPWDWGDEGDINQMGRAKPDYATKSIDEIRALPVGDLADKDCHLYLWITNRSLPKGFGLLEAWGFRYITCLTWCKPSFGLGNYFRGSTEQILFGVKGSQPLKRKDAGTWFQAPRGGISHSAKPVEFFELVESCSPGPYLEMFSRVGRKGWSQWGEATK